MFNVQLRDALSVFKNLPKPEEALQGNSMEVLAKLPKAEEALVSDSVIKIQSPATSPEEIKTVIEKPKQKIKAIKR